MDVFVTLDYELFLGSHAGTVDNCLLKPMEELSMVARSVGFHYVIFVDAAYLLMLDKLRANSTFLNIDFEKIARNIKDLYKTGHDIQMHFHPQWLYSTWDEKSGQWNMDVNHYKLSDMEPEYAFSAFKEAKILLDSIIGNSTDAFRAGGYCLSSFERYDKLFEDNGIRIDSSVARHQFVDTPMHSYDYRNVPTKHIYRFDSDVCREDGKGKFIELSISDCKWSPMDYYGRIRKKMSKYNPSVVYKDGDSVKDVIPTRLDRIKKLVLPYRNLISLDGLRSFQLNDAYQYAIKKKYDNLVIIGHPKLASDASLQTFMAFMGNVSQTHKIYTTRDIH